MLYNHDARLADQTKSHDLCAVVRNLPVPLNRDLADNVSQLQELVGFYNRMRYPDRLSFPLIPSDVYTRETANRVSRIAKDIIQIAQGHVF